MSYKLFPETFNRETMNAPETFNRQSMDALLKVKSFFHQHGLILGRYMEQMERKEGPDKERIVTLVYQIKLLLDLENLEPTFEVLKRFSFQDNSNFSFEEKKVIVAIFYLI